MEGFFAPLRDRVPGIKVPYLGGDTGPYIWLGPSSGSRFASFPHRHGFPSKGTNSFDIDFTDRSPREVAALLQFWLFFGLLIEFFGKNINQLLFVDEHDPLGKIIVVTHDVLYTLFLDWKMLLQTMSPRELKHRRGHINTILTIAVDKSEIFDRLPKELESDQLSGVLLSIKLLTMLLRSTLDDTFDNIRHPIVDYATQTRFVKFFLERRRRSTAFTNIQAIREDSPFLPLPPGCEKQTPATRLLLNRLIENGWCIHQATKVCQTYDFSVVNYLSFLPRQVPLGISHEACRETDKCVANDVDLGDDTSYKQRHVTEGCDCAPLAVDTENVTAIIEKGGVPIISLGSDGDHISLRAFKCQPWTRFVAVSHVWSDGLGNQAANALPQCQVERLRDRLAYAVPEAETKMSQIRKFLSIKGEVPTKSSYNFWMDTLCIPASDSPDQHLEGVKATAISRMAPVYARATHVMVIDRELESAVSTHVYEDGSHNDDEVAAHVLCSAWMGRSWTLQEAVLARSCQFHLANGPRKLATDSWITYYAKDKWSAIITAFHRGGEFQEERVDHGSTEAQRLHKSPFGRYIARLSRVFPALVIQAIQDDKKYLADLPKVQESKKAVSALRVPQFVRAWNSLLTRSTTQPEDRHGIFANLLDFNAHHILRLPEDQRMPKLIRSCDELPLSLLYNTGPRLNSNDRPHDKWIPSEVGGDKLAGKAVMKMSDKGFILDTTACARSTPLIFLTRAGAPRSTTFCIEEVRTGQSYLIELQYQDDEIGDSSSLLSEDAHDRYTNKIPGCLIIDKSTGSPSHNGYAGTGTFLTVSKKDGNKVFMRYRCPLIARTREQCSSEKYNAALETERVMAENVRTKYIFILDYNPSAFGASLVRRPLLSTHPRHPTWVPYVAAMAFILLTANISLILGIKGLVQWVATLWLWTAEFFLGVLVVFPTARYVARLASYKAWLATFDEDWRPGEGFMARIGLDFTWAKHVFGLVGDAAEEGVGRVFRRQRARASARGAEVEDGVGETEPLLRVNGVP